MKNSQLYAAFVNINGIISKDEKYPRKFSYALTKNLMALQDVLKPFNEEKKKVITQYAEKNEDGTEKLDENGGIIIDEGSKEEFNKAMNELLSIEVEFNPHKVSIEDTPEDIEPTVLYVLDFMIEE